MNPILKNDELNNSKQDEAKHDLQSSEKPNVSCNNGVCMVSWKPQRPAAA